MDDPKPWKPPLHPRFRKPPAKVSPPWPITSSPLEQALIWELILVTRELNLLEKNRDVLQQKLDAIRANVRVEA